MDIKKLEFPPVSPDAPVVIHVENLVKRFVLRHTRSMKEAFVWLIKGRKGDLSEKFNALNGVSLDIRQGERVALLGLNGSGKSTLLKMISGVMRADEGEVLTRGNIAGLIEVGAGFHPDLVAITCTSTARFWVCPRRRLRLPSIRLWISLRFTTLSIPR